MGQKESRGTKEDDGNDDVKRQVDSDNNYQKPIYQLVNVKNGGGKLIEILKSNARISSSSFALNKSMDLITAQKQIENSIDKQIYDLVEPLLYNEGRGKLLPLSRIWRQRLGKLDLKEEEENVGSEEAAGDTCNNNNNNNNNNRKEDRPPASSSSGRNHWVCWKLEERGFLGETALHICFLLSTPTHMILAKKLLSMFPMLINDIYTCDNFFGESSLHMAIVNENVRIVKLLLDYGANVHGRCLGSFFLPDDQKDKANNSIRKNFEKFNNNNSQETSCSEDNESWLDLEANHLSPRDVMTTNYDGYAYWGEYPLSFAACLGLSDCYKLLLAKGANPNRQDSNGNTSLHMAIIANRRDMFDLCYSNGANLSILNKQNLCPLTLAAKLRRVELFFHILTIQRQVNWIFCNVGFVEVPLSRLDSINTLNGHCDDDSVLSIVAFGGSIEHLQMLDGLLSRLLEIKWETMARDKFYLWLYKFLLFLFFSSIAYITRFHKHNNNNNNNHLAATKSQQEQHDSLSSAKLINLNQQVNFYSEIALICYVLYYLWIIANRLIPSFKFRETYKALAQVPEMFMFTLTCFLILACIPFRLLAWNQAEDFLIAIIMFILPLKLLFFCRASRSFGSFVVMIYKIVVNDVLCFVVFLVIFVAGFSQSFLIIFKTHQQHHKSTLSNETHLSDQDDKNYFVNLFDGIISMHMMAYNEFGIVFDEFESTDYPQLAKDIASQPNENVRQWARALLFVERMLSQEERLQMFDKYSHEKLVNGFEVEDSKKSSSSSRGNNGTFRYYCSTWALTQKDRDEIEAMKILNAENKKNAARLARND